VQNDPQQWYAGLKDAFAPISGGSQRDALVAIPELLTSINFPSDASIADKKATMEKVFNEDLCGSSMYPGCTGSPVDPPQPKVWPTVQSREIREGSYVDSVAWSPDELMIASGSDDHFVRTWHTRNGTVHQNMQGHSDRVISVVFSPDGKHIASGSADKTVKIWDAATGACVRTLDCLPPAGQPGAACGPGVTGHSDWVRSVAYSPDGKHIASGSREHKTTLDSTVKIWDAATGECMTTLTEHGIDVDSVAYSPDGKRIASAITSGSQGSMVKIWNVATGVCVLKLMGHSNYINSVVYSPDRQHIASGSSDKTVKIWDAATGVCVRTLTGHSDQVMSVAYSPDGKHIASSSFDKTVKIWDTATGECMRTLTGHSDAVLSVAYSPSGQHIASGSEDKAIRIDSSRPE